MKGILAVGDCNTKGIRQYVGKSYPELVAKNFSCPVKNCGFTMSTTREGISLLQDNLTAEIDVVFIQFGLVDSYTTFRYAPYVLYYPDSFWRKMYRNVIKKYKKTCRKIGLHEKIGKCNVVSEEEYESNIREMITRCGSRGVFLPETIPHHDSSRNRRIMRYNEILKDIADDFQGCHLVRAYDEFSMNMETYYHDATHMNGAGHTALSKRITEKCNEVL